MSFSINTNVASLQAQNYLSTNQAFQSKTINEVTSGLRIVNSGDDAAGLAIANGYRSDEAVLTQGIQNANNGISTLQIMDGGMSNISQLLDRARTLATQSASGTFTGSRAVLNNEYQSVLQEIDRQAQSIGLNRGGTFASNLSVFIGGGKGITAAGVISNGSVSVNLTNSTVDTQSLGLKGYTAGYQPVVTNGVAAPDSGFYDLSSGGANSVSSIINANNNTTTDTGLAQAGFTQFVFSGPGFGGSGAANGPVTVNVNLASVGDPTSLVTAINAGIATAAAGGGANDIALGAAGIQASIHTGTDGHEQLVFTSPNSAFSVAAGDMTSSALMGNLATTAAGAGATNGTATTGVYGQAIATAPKFISAGTEQTAALAYNGTSATGGTQTLTFTANDASGQPQTTAVSIVTAATTAAAVQQINTQLQATDNPTLQGIIAVADATGTHITFASNGASTFNLAIGADIVSPGVTDALGFAATTTPATSGVVGLGNTSSILTESGAQTAVSALANSVAILGSAQAAVGRGENQFTYATNLAQSELTNETAAESGIRDADLAAEAANLTKAQILLQAGVAALAQANSAPQNVLALLKA